MKQIIQDIKNGDTILEEVPSPAIKAGHVLIRSTRSLVSLGTERMLIEFGKAGWISKARQQPERVKMVLDKIKTDGLRPTIDTVLNKLAQPIPLGYSNTGVVIGMGKGVTGFQLGDRVASNGHHAEIVSVPQNLVAKVPTNVSDDEAAFTVIGAIGLQGIRLAAPTFGETIVVIGLGLIGQITAQLLKANGCRVIGLDYEADKRELAKNNGIITANPAETDPVKLVQSLTNDIGADAVLITASNKSNDIIAQAANMSRKKGRIVLVGVIGLELNRSDFFEKELSFQVSCSYGPGRYDPAYEQKGSDYPIGYVRWTEKRNFEAVLEAMSSKQLNVLPLITERIPLQNYASVYNNMSGSKSIATILEYAGAEPNNTVTYLNKNFQGRKGIIGIIGAGNFTGASILPALKKNGEQVKMIASANGLSAATLAKKFSIAQATSDYHEILNDKDVDTVFVTTRHAQHADMTIKALKAGKHVFVEKPLALTHEELDAIIETYQQGSTSLSVGFNRRFAPLAQKMKSLLGNVDTPMNIIATMNAGAIPASSWVHDMASGGGRILGEACHFIDLCTFLTGSEVTAVCMNAMGAAPEENTDNASILLRYANGSNAVINYFSNGSKLYDKERLEVYNMERTLVMENWRRLTGYGFKNFSSTSAAQDKGHHEQFSRLMKSIKSGSSPIIPFDELANTTRATIAAIDSLKANRWVAI
ncbi:MAG: bi-domain-containing oxidoreductase [Bacteroidetes bacterium]|nr:bi-domain-containing oxidoreductase [Bacteroidota bacterium]